MPRLGGWRLSFAQAWRLEVQLQGGGRCTASTGQSVLPCISTPFPHCGQTCTNLHQTAPNLQKNYTKLHQTCTKLIKLAKLPKLPGCSRFCFSNVVARQTGTRWTFNNATAKCTLHTSTNLTLHTTINCSQLQCNCQHATHWVKT